MMVGRANDGIKLGEYMQKHIWGPLDMTSTTFHLEERPDVEARLPDMSIRTPTGDLAFIPGHLIENPARDDLGGGGSRKLCMKFQAAVVTAGERNVSESSDDARGVKIGTSVNWGLGGFLVEEDTDGGRRKGSLAWGGMPNLYWWVDRETDICALYATQVVPPGDTKTLDFVRAFEREMTKRAAGMSKGKIYR
ncbi:MAG: hypothetical protein FRX48_03828 [Lasallia pustulata]|uniref:Beta-lactamase-related domain-containing protein n=1 Tax=Lasallia pustulata TaxID=136370 RepID=A0A5M8PV29_9LECA|nr:MAG: hypothetical protein FRX48_03828 [Lasallia pustulata]